VGDHVIIISYAEYDEGEIQAFQGGFAPKLVFVDEHNRPTTSTIKRGA